MDDDAGIRAALKTLLADRGYEAQTACHGEEALAMLRTGARPDAIIVDMSGWEFLDAKAADESLRSLPVFVVTAHVHDGIRLKQVVGIYRKPDGFSEMLDTLERQVPPSPPGR